MNKKIFSLSCAILCSFIWGSAFVAQDMGMDFIGPYTFTSGIMFLGFLALLRFFFIFEFKKTLKSNLNIKTILFYLLLLKIQRGHLFYRFLELELFYSFDYIFRSLLTISFTNDLKLVFGFHLSTLLALLKLALSKI